MYDLRQNNNFYGDSTLIVASHTIGIAMVYLCEILMSYVHPNAISPHHFHLTIFCYDHVKLQSLKRDRVRTTSRELAVLCN